MAELQTSSRRVGLSEIASQLGISRTLLHYYLGQIDRKPRRDEIVGVMYFLEPEVPVLIGEIDGYRRRPNYRRSKHQG